MPNILLNGMPGVGKTTIIQKVLDGIKLGARGFYTREIRERGQRVGFEIVTLSGQTATLAHVKGDSPFRVGKYNVVLNNIDDVAVPSLLTPSPEEIIVIDEIGKMECLSEEFKRAVSIALASPNTVLATVPAQGSPFIDQVKTRPDSKVFEVTERNRDRLVKDIIDQLTAI